MEGDGEVFGEIEILDKTTHGRQLEALIESNIPIGISSRGVGDMETTMHENSEYYKVMPGYSFVTFDVVAEPSVSGSYLSSVAESKSRVIDVRKQHEQEILKEFKNILYKKPKRKRR